MALSGSDSKTHPSAVSMDVLSLLRLLGRHWRVTVPAVLVTLVGLVAALQVSSPTYNATGSIVLLNPAQPPEDVTVQAGSGSTPEVGQNPFTRYGDIAIVTNILTRIMNSDSKRAELAEQGVANYDIVASPSGRDPVFEVTGHGSDADSAIRAAEIVLADAQESLDGVQRTQRADPDYFITSTSLEPPASAIAVYGSTMRTAIAALAFGGLCTLGVAVLAEVIVRRRADGQTASLPGGLDSGTANEVDAVGSNGSAKEGSDTGKAAAGVADEPGSIGSFESADLVPGRARRLVELWNSNGTPTLGRNPPSRPSADQWSRRPNRSAGSPVDEGRGQPTSDN
jgi:hypothetical protein